MDSLLTWNNILEKGYQADLCPLLYFIITKALPRLENKNHLNFSQNNYVPDEILTELKKHYQTSLLRNMILLEELKRVLTELEREIRHLQESNKKQDSKKIRLTTWTKEELIKKVLDLEKKKVA